MWFVVVIFFFLISFNHGAMWSIDFTHVRGFESSRERVICLLHCTRPSPLCAFFPWEEEAKYFHTNNVNTQHAVGAQSFSCSAQFNCIPFIPDAPLGVLSEHPVLLGALGSYHFENAANIIFLLAPCSPTLFPKFRIIVFLIRKTALNFLMAHHLPSHTRLSSL